MPKETPSQPPFAWQVLRIPSGFDNRKFTFQVTMHCTVFCGMAAWKTRQNCPVIQADMAQRLASGRPCWKVNLRLVRRPRREPDYLYEVGVKDGRRSVSGACQRLRNAKSCPEADNGFRRDWSGCRIKSSAVRE